MKDGFVRVGAFAPELKIANVSENCKNLIEATEKAIKDGIKVLVFPELSMTAYTCADLFSHEKLQKSAEEGLKIYLDSTKDLDILTFVGVPVVVFDKVYDCAAACCKGKLLGLVAKNTLANYGSFSEVRHFATAPNSDLSVDFAGQKTVLGTKIIFQNTNMREMRVAVEFGQDLDKTIPNSAYHAESGATVIANLSALPEGVGKRENRVNSLKNISKTEKTAYILANAGSGESGTDSVYSGNCFVASLGKILAERVPFGDGFAVSEVDLGKISYDRKQDNNFKCDKNEDYSYIDFSLELTDTELKCEIPEIPFAPKDEAELVDRCRLILEIQSRGLAGRLQRAHSNKMVIGVSGGLDSTLAMIVAAKAADVLGVNRDTVLAVTMPCFGTTKRTKGNAEKLSETLGAEFRTVDIKKSVDQHFIDIGHDGKTLDVTFENAQARERTQVLMDIANRENGLVIGTGDLSELMLGWATYNGDHMSMYAVNGSLPKTLIRHVVSVYANDERAKGNIDLADVLDDILATPVSPELLPPKDGEIAQCTENIVGPYELHDFFIYYTLSGAYSPRKIYRMAKVAFRDKYSDEVILHWLRVFFRRFFMQQFKRSCLPDGPKVGTLSVSPRGDLKMPSDADSTIWLKEVEEL